MRTVRRGRATDSLLQSFACSLKASNQALPGWLASSSLLTSLPAHLLERHPQQQQQRQRQQKGLVINCRGSQSRECLLPATSRAAAAARGARSAQRQMRVAAEINFWRSPASFALLRDSRVHRIGIIHGLSAQMDWNVNQRGAR